MIRGALCAVKFLLMQDHKWNKEKVTLYLCVERAQYNEEYFLVGNISELGRWKINNRMKRVTFNNSSKTFS
jgi:hypothetical protein